MQREEAVREACEQSSRCAVSSRAEGSRARLALFVFLGEYLSGLHFEIFSLFNLLPNNLSLHYGASSAENNMYTVFPKVK